MEYSFYLFIILKKHFLVASISKVKKHRIQHTFKNVGPHIWVSLRVLCGCHCPVHHGKRKKTHKERRFFTEGRSGMISVLLGYIHSTSMCNSSINWSSCLTHQLVGFQKDYLTGVIEPELLAVSLILSLTLSLSLSRSLCLSVSLSLSLTCPQLTHSSQK